MCRHYELVEISKKPGIFSYIFAIFIGLGGGLVNGPSIYKYYKTKHHCRICNIDFNNKCEIRNI